MRTHAPMLLAATLAAVPSAAADRKDIPVKYTWNLADLYPSEAAWSAGRDELKKSIAALPAYRGHLGDSADALFKALDAYFAAQLALDRLGVYATSLADQDMRESRPRELRLQAQQIATDLGAATAYIAPEIIALGPEKVRAFVAADRRLAPYAFFLDSTLRLAPHTRNSPEEKIIAEAGNMADSGQLAYSVLANADLPWPTVKLTTGDVRLDSAGYALARASPNRDDRTKVFAAFFGALKTYERTMGSTLDSQVKSHIFNEKVRSYGSCLEAALFPNAVPTAVYTQLIADVRKNLPTFFRYLKLRKRMLGLDVLRYQDIYAPLVAKVDLKYSPDEARAIVLEAVAPLGKDYQEVLKKGFESRWTDYLPSTGKRSGAYSTGVWGIHPFQLLNFNGKYEDLSTLAHESGHSMHTYLANTTQPYATSGYPIFVAEVASTLNENLLVHYLLDRTKDDSTRLALLGNYLDNLRGTLFRQTQFAEFELTIHQTAERDEPLTGEMLSKRYLELVRAYYGHEQGVTQVDDLLAVEWAYIPHFYYNFYVYQYATSMLAATALATAIREDAAKGSTAARDRYLTLLKSGGSNYPIDLLKAAGVDPTTSKPFDSAMVEMNKVMDEMDAILARQDKAKKK
ncbi:MAG TPA: oligoendopeptidase F [Myxococcaceae bacterium]|nr:oligoendopeptidase F [Myxococcaceae bacterium]